MTNTDTTGLTIQTFLPHLRDAMVFAVNRWNEVKLRHFETYFEISFQDYMTRHNGNTMERTKVVSPPFCSILNNRLEEVLGERYTVRETIGSDLQIQFNGTIQPVEQKLTTASGEGRRGFSWAGNHISNKSGWHMLIRTLHTDLGMITHAYAGMLDYDQATSSNWRQSGGRGNFGNLWVYRRDQNHLYDAIGAKETQYSSRTTKLKFLLHPFIPHSEN